MNRKDYDRKRYEIRMLKQNKEAKPRRMMSQDDELKMLKARQEDRRPMESIQLRIPVIPEPEKLHVQFGGKIIPEYFEEPVEPEVEQSDIDEENYDPDLYHDYRYNDYIQLPEEMADLLEMNLNVFIDENPRFGDLVETIADEIKKRLVKADFEFFNVKPARRRIILSILDELKQEGLLNNPNKKAISTELDNYF